MRIIFILTFMLPLLSLVSCVGTIDDANPSSSKGITVGSAEIFFEGIYDVEVIANDKVEIYFFPSQLDARNVTYVISYDGLNIPVSVPGESLRPDYRGLLKYVLTDLETNQEYTFSVQAKNTDDEISSSTLVKKGRTFSNLTANFLGVTDVKNLPGADGKTSLKVEWASATRLGTVHLPKEQDPIQYEIVLLDSDVVTPVAFDDTTFEEPTRKVILVDDEKISIQVNGLKADTNYFVRVRAIHSGVTTYGSDPNYLSDSNNSYILASTLSDDISSVKVDQESFDVEIPRGADGLYSLDTSWSAAEGSIDHYRLYYKKSGSGSAWSFYKSSKDDICNGVESTDSNWNCSNISFQKEEFTIADLTPFTDYNIHLVACATQYCESGNYVEYNSESLYRTNPGHANFSGLSSILGARNYWSLNEFYLQLTPPDINSGVIDGMFVELKARDNGPSSDTILNHPDYESGLDISVVNFDFKAATEITVGGINLGDSSQYCFELVPYYYDNGVIVENRVSSTPKCKSPKLEVPTKDDFTGLAGATLDVSTKTVNLNWSAPIQGVYSSYHLFIRTDGNAFVFSDAINGSSNYILKEIPYNSTSYQIPFLASGTYSFGILSHYDSSGVDTYSEANSSIQTITVGP